MARAELGFRTDHLLTFTLPVPRDKMVEPAPSAPSTIGC